LAITLAGAFAEAEGLGPKERRFAANAARAIMQWLRPIELAVSIACRQTDTKRDRLSPADIAVLRYLALRISIEGAPSEKASEEMQLPGPIAGRTIDDQRMAAIAAKLPRLADLPRPPDPIESLALTESVPTFIARRLSHEWGLARASSVLAALNHVARLDLRVNTLKASRDEVAQMLRREGAAVEPCAMAPHGLVAADRHHVFGAAHQRGLFEVQDEGSQLVALACGARAGDTVLDFCAGAGGKTLALAAEVGAKGKVIAADAKARRLKDLPKRAKRAGASGIIRISGAKPDETLLGKCDAVLVDAPCSGIGSFRREADLRWRMEEKALDELPVRQLAILEDACHWVRPGGRLVYSTCTPLRAENEAVVEAFLARHSDFAPGDFRPALGDAIAEATLDGTTMRIWPDRHGGGAFAAVLLDRH
jgi:16S rRNA (cytosine967-C5)-methyltransferase